MNYFWAFCVGGAICVAGQLLIDLTGLTPARILGGMPRWPSLPGAGPRFPCWALAICWQRACAPRCRKKVLWASSPAG